MPIQPPYGTSGGNKGGNPQACPPVSQALIEYLERTFPDSLPRDEQETEGSIRFRSGSVHVVRHLRSIYDRQSRNVLTP